jgi:membrane protease YdiL (CAAX protease family)
MLLHRLFAVLACLVMLLTLGQVTLATFSWLQAADLQQSRQQIAAQHLNQLLPQVWASPVRKLLQEERLDSESLRSLETLLASPGHQDSLRAFSSELLRWRGHLPPKDIVNWAGIEPRSDFWPPEKVHNPLQAISHSRRFPLIPGSARLLSLWISWGVLLALLLSTARAMREPSQVFRYLPRALLLSLVALLPGALALGLGLEEGSLPPGGALLAAGSLLLQTLTLTGATACGLKLLPPQESPDGQDLPVGLICGLVLTAWSLLCVTLIPTTPGELPAMAESLRLIFGIPAPSLPTNLANALAAAASEELLFRVLLLGGVLTWTRSRRLALVLSATLWSLLHLGLLEPNWIKLLQVYPAGILLGHLCLSRGPRSALQAHLTWNLLSCLIG